MLYAPVTHYSDGEWTIIPLSPISYDKEWSDVIGFHPMEHFSPVSIEDSYMLKISARSGKALSSEVPHLPHPHDPSQTIPYGADVNFNYMPVCVTPVSILL